MLAGACVLYLGKHVRHLGVAIVEKFQVFFELEPLDLDLLLKKRGDDEGRRPASSIFFIESILMVYALAPAMIGFLSWIPM